MWNCRSMSVVMLLLAVASGCGSGEEIPPIYEIEGTVLLDGKPLDRISVTFLPADDGPRSSGVTDENGRFVLKTFDQVEQNGAVASRCKVVLLDNSVFKEGIENLTPSQKRGMDLSSGKPPRIADKYSSYMTTPLAYEVTGEDKDVKFEVEAYGS